MKLTKDKIVGAVLIDPTIFKDARGYFLTSYDKDEFSKQGFNFTPVSESRSNSIKNVIRGLHFQLDNPQARLIEVIHGEIFDVAVDVRINSPTFGLWSGVILSSSNFKQYYLPEGIAHGFAVLSNEATIVTKLSARYSPWSERGINWDDSRIGVNWPITDPILSEKDRSFPGLSDLIKSNELPYYNKAFTEKSKPLASCFISYSSYDYNFAEKLQKALEACGVLCWFAPDDMDVGDRIRDTLEKAIELNEKVILILSERSIESDWVEVEVEKTLDRERSLKSKVLMPISLDSAIFNTNKAWAAHIKRTRHIGDFSDWNKNERFEVAFSKLMRALLTKEND